MTQLTPQEFERISSLYLDRELEQNEQKKFEEFLSVNIKATNDFDLMKTIHNGLIQKKSIEKNDWFWLSLSNKIEDKHSFQTQWFIKHRQPFVFYSVLVFTSFIIGIIYYRDAPIFKKYFYDKKNQITNNFFSGNIFPFFTNLDNDKVLQFALFGNLPMDSASTTELSVKNENQKMARIEIGKHDAAMAPAITVKDFVREVGITPIQKIFVDSMLGRYTERLQACVLVDEKNTFAINEELANLNKVMVSTIAATLEPIQRERFQKLLEVRNSPFSFVAFNTPPAEPTKLLRHIRSLRRSNKFVIISYDSIRFADIEMNLDSIRDYSRQFSHKMQKEQVYAVGVMRTALENRRIIQGDRILDRNSVRVVNGQDAFQIQFETRSDDFTPLPDVIMREILKPRTMIHQIPNQANVRMFTNRVRIKQDSSLFFEMNTDSLAVQFFRSIPKGDFQFEFVDSIMKPKMSMKIPPSQKKEFEKRIFDWRNRDGRKIDLDSLLEEANKKSNLNMPKNRGSVKVIEL